MTRIYFESCRNVQLAGIIENESAKKCVILVHGFLDDKTGNGRWDKIGKKLKKQYAVFRFDFAGHGESQNAPISIKGEIKDLTAAINLMKKKYERIALVGHSLGGLLSLKLANKVDCVVSLAGATSSSTPASLMNLVTKEDENTITFNSKNREYIVLKEYLKERKNVNTKRLISKISVPTLLIHGTKDKHVSIDQTYKAKKYLSNGYIKIVDDDHFFLNSLDEITDYVNEFIKRYL